MSLRSKHLSTAASCRNSNYLVMERPCDNRSADWSRRGSGNSRSEGPFSKSEHASTFAAFWLVYFGSCCREFRRSCHILSSTWEFPGALGFCLALQKVMPRWNGRSIEFVTTKNMLCPLSLCHNETEDYSEIRGCGRFGPVFNIGSIFTCPYFLFMCFLLLLAHGISLSTGICIPLSVFYSHG